MRLCLIARALTVISIALMAGSAGDIGVRRPYWPVWPRSWRTVGELGLTVCAFTPLFRPVSRCTALV